MLSVTVPARVGLLGNPSDGYGGRTIALALDRFAANVELEPHADAADRSIVVEPGPEDATRWDDADDLVTLVDRRGYGTGPQLLTAAVRTFCAVADSQDRPRPDGFTLRYRTTIPRQVGLAGSSALVIGALRCLCRFADLDVPDAVLPSIALRVETEQLGIQAGLQDRVVQTYGGLVEMDFADLEVDGRFGVAHGRYERLDPSSLPPLFCAYRTDAAEPSGDYHATLRSRFAAGDPVVRETMHALATLVLEGKAALRWHDGDRFARLIGENMTLRRRLGPLPDSQLALVEVAEDHGATATFTGSGGAVVGALGEPGELPELVAAYGRLGAECFAVEV